MISPTLVSLSLEFFPNVGVWVKICEINHVCDFIFFQSFSSFKKIIYYEYIRGIIGVFQKQPSFKILDTEKDNILFSE